MHTHAVVFLGMLEDILGEQFCPSTAKVQRIDSSCQSEQQTLLPTDTPHQAPVVNYYEAIVVPGPQAFDSSTSCSLSALDKCCVDFKS